ncbi:[acyl-carrier-protein] S-malonyltransferase [Ruminococcus sp. AF37-6AT]|nr:[acyl-carrier-protein] S-malonyltransferase [Ruminococcus sp. AF37-6AT]RHP52697.1 [acyl-carrier-protein] S-malonyltransferase [Ruminococcus sp. AF31-16BH]RHQ96704.1 [acyl-carrier-protein] S-malonyltransferase [Ruminococcus sp. AF21-3]
MSKIAFVFPGQGAQYTGMAKDFYEKFPVSREVFEKASKVSGLDIKTLCFEENENLNITEYTQIAMLTAEIAILRAVEEAGIHSQVNAGLSLGEYGALAASGVMREEDAFAIVRKRGILMQEAYPTGGAMSAILGTDAELIEKICEETPGIVSIANYNCPGQIVITGEEKAVLTAGEALKAAGARRVIPLKVSGPFHCELLKEAGKKLGEELEKIEIQTFAIPYVTNVTAQYITESDQVKNLLVKQVSSSVRWQQCVEQMINDGVDTFIEIGPGKTLTGFLKKINRNVKALHIEKIEDLEAVRKECL